MGLGEAFALYGPIRTAADEHPRSAASEVILDELYRLARCGAAGGSDRDDVVMSALVNLLRFEPGRRYPEFNAAQVRGFLARVLHSAAISAGRRQRCRPEHALETLPELPAPMSFAAGAPTAREIEAAWVELEVQILPGARPAGRCAGLAFERDIALVIEIGRGRRSRLDIVEGAWRASAAEPVARAASRIDRRLGRARERLAPVAFERLRTTTRIGTRRAVALACVFIDLGLRPEWVSDPARSAVDRAAVPRKPRPGVRGDRRAASRPARPARGVVGRECR